MLNEFQESQPYTPVIMIPRKIPYKKYLPPESFEEISNILTTIKQYHDDQDSQLHSNSEFFNEFFNILGFSTEELSPFFTKLHVMGTSSNITVATLNFISPGNEYEQIFKDTNFSINHNIHRSKGEEWKIFTDGIRLKVILYKNDQPQKYFYRSNFDDIIRNEKLDSFFPVYKIFSYIKTDQGRTINRFSKQNRHGKKMDQAKSPYSRFDFWRQLLEKAILKTSIFANISPGNDNWISTGAGQSGVNYCFIVRMDNAQVELYIDKGETDLNKTFFNSLFQSKEKIEIAFGEPLDWQILSNKRACRIRYLIPDYGLNDLAEWDELQNLLVNAMIRLENAFRPLIRPSILDFLAECNQYCSDILSE